MRVPVLTPFPLFTCTLRHDSESLLELLSPRS